MNCSEALIHVQMTYKIELSLSLLYLVHYRNWREVAMSAVCVFAMRDIENLFDTGRFLSERLMQMEPLNS